jgi:hypothetical protein
MYYFGGHGKREGLRERPEKALAPQKKEKVQKKDSSTRSGQVLAGDASGALANNSRPAILYDTDDINYRTMIRFFNTQDQYGNTPFNQTAHRPLVGGNIVAGFVTTQADYERVRHLPPEVANEQPGIQRDRFTATSNSRVPGAAAGVLSVVPGNIYMRLLDSETFVPQRPLESITYDAREPLYPMIHFPHDFNPPAYTQDTLGILWQDPTTGKQFRCRLESAGNMGPLVGGFPYFRLVYWDQGTKFLYGLPIFNDPRLSGAAPGPSGSEEELDLRPLEDFEEPAAAFGKRRKKSSMKSIMDNIRYLKNLR